MYSKYDKISELILNSNNVVILSGAGVSTNSGIPDFRSRGGFYDGNGAENFLSRSYYNKDIKSFWKAYIEIFGEKLISENYEPNEGHLLAGYLKSLGKNVKVITQNVDGLYFKVPELNFNDVIEYHGNATNLICCNDNCGHNVESSILLKLDLNTELPICPICSSNLDVDVVLFGDTVRCSGIAQSYVNVSDLIIVMGTGLQVYPFNSLLTNNKKRKNILLNYTDIPKKRFEVKLLQDISKSVNEIVGNLKVRI